jgi:hypothetical protein
MHSVQQCNGPHSSVAATDFAGRATDLAALRPFKHDLGIPRAIDHGEPGSGRQRSRPVIAVDSRSNHTVTSDLTNQLLPAYPGAGWTISTRRSPGWPG